MITDQARNWAQRPYPPFHFAVTGLDIARFAHAIEATDPIHFDQEAARAAGYPDVVAPALFPYVIRMHAYNLVNRDQLEEDGSPTADVPPLPTRRAMAGEVSIELGAPIFAGDVITVEKALLDFYEKEGRSGPLVFVKMAYRYTNQTDQFVARESFTRIYR
ncbi:MAG: FAS1-like dehydratase domain-containing protein [Acidimicrobiia bacterium]